jgi:hypothetical protein
MLTGKPLHGVLVETKAIKLEAPVELNVTEVCAVCGVPLI